MRIFKFFETPLLILFILSSFNLFAQFSKTHYIPPVATTGDGAANPLDQYLYISTPNETPVDVTITPIGGESITVSVSEPRTEASRSICDCYC